METDLSEYHKGTDGLYYADYIAPNKAETFIGKLVSTEWWHHRLPYSLFKNIPVFTDQDTGMLISEQWRRALFGNVKSK